VSEHRDPLARETTVNQGASKKRGLFWMDGWHFVCPVTVPGIVGILMTSGLPQVYWIIFTVVCAIGAMALHQWNPWWLSDYQIELFHTPKYLTDIVSDDLSPAQRSLRWIDSLLKVKP
jgi:hypothetical protein